MDSVLLCTSLGTTTLVNYVECRRLETIGWGMCCLEFFVAQGVVVLIGVLSKMKLLAHTCNAVFLCWGWSGAFENKRQAWQKVDVIFFFFLCDY